MTYIVKLTDYHPHTHTEFLECEDYEYEPSEDKLKIDLYDQEKHICSREMGPDQSLQVVRDGKVIEELGKEQ